MKNQFNYQEAPTPAPIRVEQVVAEVPGGGLLKDAGYDVVQTTPVGRASDGKYQVIKTAKVKEKYQSDATSLVVEKGSGIAKNDYIAFDGIAVQVTAVNAGADKDTFTITKLTGKTIEVGDFVYQAAAEADGSSSKAAPVVNPIGIVDDGHFTAANGVVAYGGNGDTPVRIVVAGTVRKETCMFGAEMESLLKGIHRV